MNSICKGYPGNIAFAGLRHLHIFDLYKMAAENELINVIGAFEENENARRVAQEKGVNITYNSYCELLSDDNVSTVAIGDYYANRGNLAIKALKAGKNVICDKPMCTSLEELETIEKLAVENGLTVSCMFSMRYDAIAAAAKEAMSLIGEVKSIYFGGQHPLLYNSRPSWYFEDGKYGGLFNDLAIHGIDLIYYLCGQRVKNVIAARSYNAYAKSEPHFPDSGQLMAELTNGAGLIADVSYSVPDKIAYNLPYYWQFYIWGENGMMSFSANSEYVECFTTETFEKIIFNKPDSDLDYLSDFVNLAQGKEARLPMEEVFKSTRDTLTIQKRSNL